jgi:hypothetical protein
MFKVYQHRRKDNNEIFYVGHGSGSRPWQFTRGRSKGWQEIFLQAGCKVETVAKFDTKEEAAEYEIKLIAEYKAQGFPLVNKRSGGFDKTESIPHSEEAKQKISRARLQTNASRKLTKTPLGIFKSMVEASKAHNLTIYQMKYRIETKPGYEFV